jgi:CRISPR-associated endonuclease/helicase Cas3
MSAEIPMETLIRFWAKTTHDQERFPNAYHPLICHMIDVAVVTLIMWEEVLPKAAKKRIASSLGLSTDKHGRELAGRIVAWIAGLHDLGKASPPFALRETPQNIRRIYDHTLFSLPYPPPEARAAPHGYVTATELPEILERDFGVSYVLAECIGVMIGGHHGVFPRNEETNKLRDNLKYIGRPDWAKVRRALAIALAQTFDLPRPLGLADVAVLDNGLTMYLAGLVSVADWIGSNASYFSCAVEDFTRANAFDVERYPAHAKVQAHKALAELGWLGWPENFSPLDFDQIFPTLKGALRPLQTAVVEIAETLRSPGLVVFEAPMGEGKTEAAIYLADRWNAELHQRGVYFALPTQATSNQMFGRVRQYLKDRFKNENILLQLLHGHASLLEEFETLLKEGKRAHQVLNLQGVQDDALYDFHDCTANVVAATWFTHRKRGLLAPFGVGTVDQALLAVLHTRHVFVRLFGLGHKTIVVDEVHAYDAYMSALLERLLEWLAALGSPVVLLSATLPKERRNRLLQAYRRGLGAADNAATFSFAEDCYPRITWATWEQCHVRSIDTSSQNTRILRLQHVSEDVMTIGEKLHRVLEHSGCASIICNTVQTAQDVYESLKPYFAEDELDLLHARYLFKDRAEREARTLDRFGKPGGKVVRPRRAVLVSTQIIEQSLDLDFDLMITELSPADLMLQRAGRLHRHQRAERPRGLGEATLWICSPTVSDQGRPDFGKSKYIYSEHVLLRSWLAVKDRGHIAIPGEIEELIESVYDGARKCPEPSLADLWSETEADLKKKLEEKETNALYRRIKPPDYEQLLDQFNPELEEDNPEFHQSMQALTRDDDTPSISVVFLSHEEAGRERIVHSVADSRYLLEHSVNISTRGAIRELIACKPPSAWRQSALLRHHRLLTLDENGQRRLGDYQFTLDDQLGVVITKIGKETD